MFVVFVFDGFYYCFGFDEQYCYGVVYVFVGYLLYVVCVGGVQFYVYLGCVVLLVKVYLCVGDLIVGGDFGFFQNYGLVILGFEWENFGVWWCDVGVGLVGGILVGDQMEFQGCGVVENMVCLGGVLYIGQLYYDVVGVLMLYYCVVDVEFVDLVVQCGVVLVDGVILQFIQCVLVECQGQLGLFFGLVQGEFWQCGVQWCLCCVGGDLVVQGDDQFLVFDVYVMVMNIFVMQCQFGLVGLGVYVLFDYCGYVYLQQEVYFVMQVQVQVYG